jgi:hypothetical protein
MMNFNTAALGWQHPKFKLDNLLGLKSLAGVPFCLTWFLSDTVIKAQEPAQARAGNTKPDTKSANPGH